jgi:uncharacterized repeat protein (TIGR01451 family)
MSDEAAAMDVHDVIGLGLPPLPLLVKDVTIETTISSDGSTITYTVRIENNSGEPLGKLRVTPSVPPSMFSLDEEFKTLPPIDIGKSASTTFILKPLDDAWHLGVEGRALAGKDVTVRTILRCQNGQASFFLEVQNNRNFSVRKLKVKPVLPNEYVATKDSEEIEALGPNEKKTIQFPVITKDEWDLIQLHEQGMARPFFFSPERPRRKRRGYPRSHTAEEMSELRKTLMLAESDEEMLEHIGKDPVEEEAIEDNLVIDIEEFVEEDPLEEELEPYMEPVEEEGPVEEGFMLTGVTVEPISEEDAFEEEPDLSYELPMEEVSEFPPWEDDIDHEAIRTVKPLGPAGAKAEDIETEPLEMDL